MDAQTQKGRCSGVEQNEGACLRLVRQLGVVQLDFESCREFLELVHVVARLVNICAAGAGAGCISASAACVPQL